MSGRRDFLRAAGASVLALGPLQALAGTPASPSPAPEPPMTPALADGRHDFDFFHGRWTVRRGLIVTAIALTRPGGPR